MVHLALFASGSGTNAENLIRFFSGSSEARVTLVLCNRPDAGVIDRANKLQVPVEIFSKADLYETDHVRQLLVKHEIDLIILAGFLWLIPVDLLRSFSKRMINIHPALLPKYGGKGMYGATVHQAVLANQEKVSGITIHLIDEEYDKGKILHQETCPVFPNDTPDSLAERIHQLEYIHFPLVIRNYLSVIR